MFPRRSAFFAVALLVAGAPTQTHAISSIALISLNSQAPSSIAVAAGTRMLLAAGSSAGLRLTLSLVSIDSHKVLRILRPALASLPSPSMAISEHANRAFVAAGYTYGSPETAIISLTTRQIVGTIRSTHVQGRPSPGESFDVAPSGRAVDDADGHLFVLNRVTIGDSTDNSVAMLDDVSGHLLHITHLGANDVPVAEAVSARHRILYITTDGSNKLISLDTIRGNIVHTIAVGANPCAVAVDEARDRVAVVNEAAPSSLSVLDGATGRLLKTIPLGIPIHLNPPCSLVVDEHSGHAFVLGQGTVKDGIPTTKGSVAVVDLEALRLIARTPLGFAPMAAASTHGRLVVANYGNYHTHGGGSISVVDGASGRILAQLAVTGNPNAVAADDRTGQAFVSIANIGNGDPVATYTSGAIAVIRP